METVTAAFLDARFDASRFTLDRVRDGVTDVRPVAISLTEAVSNLSWSRGLGLQEEVVARRRLCGMQAGEV